LLNIAARENRGIPDHRALTGLCASFHGSRRFSTLAHTGAPTPRHQIARNDADAAFFETWSFPMTSIATRAPAQPARFIRQRVFALAADLIRSLWRSWQIRERTRELHAMPDELLKDVGIYRCEIEQIATALVDAEIDPTRRLRGWN